MIVEEDDYQGLVNVSKKDHFVLQFWRKALIQIYEERGNVSAGEVGKFVGQSRTTAKKYLDKLIAAKCVDYTEKPHINGIVARYYFPVKANPNG